MKVQGCPTGYQIGFGGTFYTLWYVGIADRNGFQQADYCGRISTRKDEAKAKYPEYPITMLKGQPWTIFSDPSKKEVKSFVPREERTEFWFGKYSGQPISECTDYKYLKWFHEEYSCFGTYPTNYAIKVVMEQQGYVFYKGQIYDNQEAVERKKHLETFYSCLNGYGKMPVTFISNLNRHTYRVTFEIDDEVFTEDNPYGWDMSISDELMKEVAHHNSGKYNWMTVGDVRSMKGQEAIITTNNNSIIKIEYK